MILNSCYSVDGSEDNSTIIMVGGGVLGASIILVFIVALIVGVIIFVLCHKHKKLSIKVCLGTLMSTVFDV